MALLSLENSDGATDAGFTCGDEGQLVLSDFLERLRVDASGTVRRLPDLNGGFGDYTAIIGHADEEDGYLYGLRGPRPAGDCHSPQWDGLVPTSSADGGVILNEVRNIETSHPPYRARK